MGIAITAITGSESAVERIGMGHCGSVWASKSSIALKREDGGPGRSLVNEHDVHRTLLRAAIGARQLSSSSAQSHQINIPLCPAFSPPTTPRFGLRIPPMPEPARRLLVEKYCPEPIRESILADPKNEDCIIRAYLGRRRFRPRAASRFAAFSLRDYPLHVDQMEDLGLDLPAPAAAMAQALAFMRWRARVDANDVEFVLAPARGLGEGATFAPGGKVFDQGLLGSHVLWVLDFDCCRKLSMDEEGVAHAFVKFYRNNPFYPRPGTGLEADERHWELFREAYLETSDLLLTEEEERVQKLP
ncbi:uncharacterized protein VDAG_05863 [Verticillium dahliae VdLs.17]|uniref:DUF3669 domain-containing protein n=4 Tax=Verticillium dahliae TaxID=27337 RepID=G2X6T1_VERDV|nr:uncharacterized protein VDAG_05863 [Verticillium dahliae VdLs.17]EGY14699.1 hypothetical protein VDAG_05863 [Verticillium dahliae VdLs.17]KAH6708241.1 zinc finger protein-domain-containing protein [Verticillium dahliae]